MIDNEYIYDVALSFAGEDRSYVEQVAEILVSLRIKVFYDNHFKTELWGKNLYKYLANLYSKEAKYAVIFISSSYSQKDWTKHELEFIFDRQFKDKEYFLPYRLDSTKIEGIPETTGYLEDLTPNELAYFIAKKVNPEIDVKMMLEELRDNLSDYEINVIGTEIHFYCEVEYFEATYPLSLLMEMYKQDLMIQLFVHGSIVPN